MKYAYNMKLGPQEVARKPRKPSLSWSTWVSLSCATAAFTIGSFAVDLNDARGYLTGMGLAAFILNFIVCGICIGHAEKALEINRYQRLTDNLFRMNSAILRRLHGQA